jgi:hypothetical protein
MVINIEDGGSLTFYKDWGLNKSRRGSSGSIAGNGSVASGLNGGNMKRVSSTSSLLELYDNTANQSITIDESTDVKQSIFLRQSKSRRNVMEVDEETKAKIEKVSVYVSSSEFREPMEMPYLKIPAVSLVVLLCLLICCLRLSVFYKNCDLTDCASSKSGCTLGLQISQQAQKRVLSNNSPPIA